MKILFLGSVAPGGKTSYGGGGWMTSLASSLSKNENVDLFFAELYDKQIIPFQQNGFIKYPICRPKSFLQKVLYKFFLKYRKKYEEKCFSYALDAIRDISPDLILVIGAESVFRGIIGKTNIPVVLYIQGLLNPIYNSFYPVNMSDASVRFIEGINGEWIFQNGIVGSHLNMKVRACRELELYKKVDYVIGRTNYDYKISRLLAPESKYFRLNEMMRSSFYVDIPWKKQKREKYYIVTTLNGVTYKGLDVILKTAMLLKEKNVIFEWNVVGLNKEHRIVRLFEKSTSIMSDKVNVKFLGVLSEEQLKHTLLESDVMVHPSYVDNSPNSVCEAQLVGLPVIATYVGGIPDFVKNGITGITVPLNAPYEIAYHIIEDIRQPYLYKYSEPARVEALERHDRDAIISDIMKIFNFMLDENKEQEKK